MNPTATPHHPPVDHQRRWMRKKRVQLRATRRHDAIVNAGLTYSTRLEEIGRHVRTITHPDGRTIQWEGPSLRNASNDSWDITVRWVLDEFGVDITPAREERSPRER